MYRSPEHDFKLIARGFERTNLHFSKNGLIWLRFIREFVTLSNNKTYISGIIDDNVDAAEFIDRFGEDGFHLLDFRDIESNNESTL